MGALAQAIGVSIGPGDPTAPEGLSHIRAVGRCDSFVELMDSNTRSGARAGRIGAITSAAIDPGASPVDRALEPLARRLDADKMALLGIRNTMRLAKGYNSILRGHRQRMRKAAWNGHFEELAAEAGRSGVPRLRIGDGWAIDTSCSLPHLEEMLRHAEEVIAERGGAGDVDDRYRAFFRNLISVEDHQRWPAFLDFGTSPELLATVADHLGFVPALSNTLPAGVRLVESGKHLDALAHLPPRDSQVFHIDPYDQPLVYVIVLVRDCAADMGPFTFLPASASQAAAKKLDYWSRHRPYRLSDEEIYSAASEAERLQLVYPRGTVLFVDTSRCFHYGARDGERPRFQAMFGYTSVCRSDFSETYMPATDYPARAGDSRLTRLVLDRRADGF